MQEILLRNTKTEHIMVNKTVDTGMQSVFILEETGLAMVPATFLQLAREGVGAVGEVAGLVTVV